MTLLWLSTSNIYRQISDISRTLLCNKLVDHSHVVGALPVGAAPTTYIYILDFTLGFNGLGKDNCKMRWEAFKVWGFGEAYIRDLTVDWNCLSGNGFWAHVISTVFRGHLHSPNGWQRHAARTEQGDCETVSSRRHEVFCLGSCVQVFSQWFCRIIIYQHIGIRTICLPLYRRHFLLHFRERRCLCLTWLKCHLKGPIGDMFSRVRLAICSLWFS